MNTSIPNYNYQRRLVVFFDVLGWKNKINKSENDPELLEALSRLVTLISTAFTDNLSKENDVVWTSFSDNVVVSWDYDPNKLSNIIGGLCRLQLGIAMTGFYIRGGITIGNLLHLQDRVLGPALNRAYELESRHAVFPRIVLDPNEYDLKEINSIYLSHDQEFTFLDPFSLTFIKEACSTSKVTQQGIEALKKHAGVDFYPPNPDTILPLIAQLITQIQAEYKNAEDDHTREKYNWLLQKLNRSWSDALS